MISSLDDSDFEGDVAVRKCLEESLRIHKEITDEGYANSTLDGY